MCRVEGLQRLPPVAARWGPEAPEAPSAVGLTISVPTHAALGVQVFNRPEAEQTGVSAQVTIDGVSLEELAGLRDAITAEVDRLSRGG